MKQKKTTWMPRHPLGTYAMVLACGAAVGCGDHSKGYHPAPATTAQTVEIDGAAMFRPSWFNLKSNDNQALSTAGSDTSASAVQTWTEATSRAQIATWVDDAGDLYVSYSIGDGQFSAPVPIRTQRVGPAAPQVEGVVFLNTQGSSDPEAFSRHGDAILIFSDDDPGDLSQSSPDPTTRLYSSYFDLSLLSTPSHRQQDAVSGQELEFQYGWQVVGLPVDDDPDDSDAASVSLNVSLAGFVSDSTHRSHGGDARSSGDPTTFVHAVWSQVRPGTIGEQRLQSKRFGLEVEGFSFPTGAPQVSSVESPSAWTAHDGLLLTQENTDLVAVVFDADTTPRVDHVQTALAGGVPTPGNVYGPDHGMGHWAFVFVAAEQARLGTIDGLVSNVTSLTVSTGTARVISRLESRIVRDGTWIAASWIEGDDLLAAAIDTSQTTSPSSTSTLTTFTGALDYAFQTELDYRCGVQADSSRVNWIYQENDDLHVVGLRASFSGATIQGTVVGSALVSSFTPVGPLSTRAVCYDRGDVDGSANVVFLAGRDLADERGGQRLFHYSGQHSVDVDLETDQISALAQRGQQEAIGGLKVRTTPTTPHIGLDPNYAGHQAHILFTEQREGTGEATLQHLRWDKTVVGGELSSTSLVSLDTPRDVGNFEVLHSGQLLEIYFEQAGHLFFNRWAPMLDLIDVGGLSNPYLIDEVHPEEVGGWSVHGDTDHTPTNCDDGPGAAVFYDKTFGPSDDQRLLVRMRLP